MQTVCLQLKAFQQSLNQLQQTIEMQTDEMQTDEIDSSGLDYTGLDYTKLGQASLTLQNQFQEIVTTLGNADINPAIEQRLMTYQTEAHRRLRLMGIEAMRLRTARQAQLIARGRSQLTAHIQQLQQFVQAMIDEVL